MKILSPLLIIGIAVLSASCSNRQIYQAIQTNQQQECKKLQLTAYEECLQAYNTPYDDYQKLRTN